MTRTLLLDLDGTLINSAPDLLASCNRVMTPRGFAPFTLAQITPMIGDGAATLVARIMAARDQPSTPDDLRAFLADYLAHPVEHTHPYPGVPETLDLLSRTGWRLAICTNKPEAAARAILDHLGLSRHFPAIGAGDTYPVRKPDPGHLLATLAAAGGDPATAIMVGDHHNDVAAAHAAQLPCIFVTWGYGPPTMGAQAEALAHAFTEIPNLAEQILTQATIPQTHEQPVKPKWQYGATAPSLRSNGDGKHSRRDAGPERPSSASTCHGEPLTAARET